MASDEERSRKSLSMLAGRLAELKGLARGNGYLYSLAGKYHADARHYFEKGDYFTSFGCSDYAYGILDALDYIVNGNGPKP